MSNELQWTPRPQHDPALDRLKPFTEPLSPAVATPSESHLQEFAAVIENVIVPRLLMSHVHSNRSVSTRKPHIDAEGVKEFIELTMHDQPDAAVNFVQSLLDQGYLFQDVLLKLMAPAARDLGERWVHDSTSFVEVTLGVARMHRILREFDGVPENMWSQSGAGGHVLLVPVPGEQHTFGLRLIQEFLLRESWSVTSRSVMSQAELLGLVSEQDYDIIGLSLSGETLIESMRSSIAAIRAITRSARTRIIIGGHLLAARPELVNTMGADGYAADAPTAVALCNGWAGELLAAN